MLKQPTTLSLGKSVLEVLPQIEQEHGSWYAQMLTKHTGFNFLNMDKIFSARKSLNKRNGTSSKAEGRTNL